MAFDGFTVAALTHELGNAFQNTRINKIAQPEKEELLLTIKGNSATLRLLMSADASLPLMYLTEENKQSPLNAPNFCMLLRKYLTNAKIISVTQPGLERVVKFTLEHLDEMGDLCRKHLYVELMGKHSNIIFNDDKDMIIDSIKHVSHNMSSVREVLPGREYFIPKTQDKIDPILEKDNLTYARFKEIILSCHTEVYKAIYTSFTGFSPLMASEICFRAGIDSEASVSFYIEKENELKKLFKEFYGVLCDITEGTFAPEVIYDKNVPLEYAALTLTMYKDLDVKKYDSISKLISGFYKEKSQVVLMRQKTADLRKIVQTVLERNVKKLDLQKKQLLDTEKKEKYRIYGELINTYGYSVPEGAKNFEAINYYTNEPVTIPLDPDISVMENGKKYFEKYGKLKRTAENLTGIIEEVSSEIEHLESVLTSLDIAVCEADLKEIKEELKESGYIKGHGREKKEKVTSKPFHYISSDGFHIYVGRNNYQNDKLTFELSNGGDWWFHAKKMPGSHVIVKSENKEVPDTTFEEAARLAAYYSAGRKNEKVEIDYTLKKNVKKPSGGKPGFVVYYTNYSMMIDTDITNIKAASE
ncbi:MAG: NFACT family protein [Lachnospiraceae bacterium]|nr:NFACT family protein [Lachnospiraceae bacterium]